MGNFNRGGNFRSGGRDRGGRDRGDRKIFMHKTTCSECGNECEVPFRPTGEKPVYCSSCFENQQDNGGGSFRRGGDRDRGSRDRGGDRSFGRRSFGEDKPMFKATCSDCGNQCEVPFRPTGEKPVYCSDCFRNNGGNKGGSKGSDNSGKLLEQFEKMNAKLDKILTSLVGHSEKKVVVEKQVEKAVVKIADKVKSAEKKEKAIKTVSVPKKKKAVKAKK